MRKTKLYMISFVSVLILGGCEWGLNPENDNHSTFDRIYDDPAYAEGLLITAYTLIPTNSYRFDETATDDAVTNDLTNTYLYMAKGMWTAEYNPQDLWKNCNRGILYINEFLDVIDEVAWKPNDSELNSLFIRRLKGESYALRGILKYYLLRNHAGPGTSGEMLGIPIYDSFIQPSDFAMPRASFTESAQSAYDDFEKALSLLPFDYGNKADLPDGFKELNGVDSYNFVMGDAVQQRISGRIVKAFKAKLAILEASPIFNVDNDLTLWTKAANLNAELLDMGKFDPKGNLFYLKAQIDAGNITANDQLDNNEIVWRRPISSSRTMEVDNFPPSLYGNGRINPTQNLVDAFPMKNGYPITDSRSNFDPSNPYDNRDPRLEHYIIYDGSTYKNKKINTGVNAGDNGLNARVNSTRTGYYMKKLLREDANPNPASTSDQQHIIVHIRQTELFLNYAEAANEAWGPSANAGNHFSAKDVIAAIRKRAGITQPDTYLESITTKDDMRELIRNERRLELCFEGFRFWDIRRWNLDLTEVAKGVRIENGQYNYFMVEDRVYDNSYMHYGPIPYTEVLKYSLEQNAGW